MAVSDPAATSADAESAVDGKALVRDYLEDVFTNGNIAGMDRYLDGAAFKAGVADLVARWRTAFPDFRIVVDRAIAEGDRVVTVEILSGTHLGLYQSTIGPIEPSGQEVTWSRIAIRRLRGGRFVEGFFEEDEVGLLRQMGALTMADDWAESHRAASHAADPSRFRVMDAVARDDRGDGPEASVED
jgi:predicted ester cyclase